MKRPRSTLVTACLLVSLPLATQIGTAQAPAATANGGTGFVVADAQFMQGMIGHHAQALVMAAWAPTHGASARVALLCRKIMISQHDEIVMMQNWLKDRNQSAPDPSAMPAHDGMIMSMADPAMLMPGMLTAEQLKQLDQAKDTAFDRLLLTGMIQHHEGALKMVADLFATPSAGQGSEIFRYATDVDADQRAEIDRMQQMLNSSPGSKSP